MTVKIPDGRYLMGVELGKNEDDKMVFVPVGPRNIPNWARMFSVSEEDFGELMRDRARAQHLTIREPSKPRDFSR